MHIRRILGVLFFAAAALLAFSQTYLFITRPPYFSLHYAIQLSFESYGFAILALIAGIFMFHGRARFWSWFALVVAGAGLWVFVIREIWLYYFVLPQMQSDYLATHSYFTGPLWWVLVRLSWHIILPTIFILAAYLLLKHAPHPRAACPDHCALTGKSAG